MRRLILPLLASSLIMLASGSAWAGPPSDAVKTRQTELFKLLEGEANEANKKKIAAIFDELIDYDFIAEQALGDELKTLKDDEKKEFKSLLKQLVTRAYEKNLRKTLSWNIEYLAEEKTGSEWIVKTRAKHKTDTRQDPIKIDFKLVDKGSGKFRMSDIITEDVSLVSSYRAQFTKIIKKDGYAGLAKKMKDKIAKGDG
ncbi:MAG: ABC transporter substrate-binding protein [Polyangiaceae bacterium]|mgnify:CR=1 FL=1|jgi:phospholipid transport system substrate-binding protein|nr:ABC transporter substrate-binding protein [Polyangiaceae bacterium]MBK8936934.1 ABC transporter substrate-binding protein [Polyangiaceae bacterium]